MFVIFVSEMIVGEMIVGEMIASPNKYHAFLIKCVMIIAIIIPGVKRIRRYNNKCTVDPTSLWIVDNIF